MTGLVLVRAAIGEGGRESNPAEPFCADGCLIPWEPKEKKR